jgi:mannose-1-phosphate guanylyltransferase/phosphomannomutase
MRAVLMAGGSGTRLRPLTCDLPKPMVPILNRPIAEHIVNLLKRNGINEVISTLFTCPMSCGTISRMGGTLAST